MNKSFTRSHSLLLVALKLQSLILYEKTLFFHFVNYRLNLLYLSSFNLPRYLSQYCQ